MHLSRRSFLFASAGATLSGCISLPRGAEKVDRATVEIFSPNLEALVSPKATLETLGTGYQWAEGPVWDPYRKALYFTDVPQNKAYMWRAGEDVSVFLDPSGSTEAIGQNQAGANGLLIGRDRRLILCNHGDRSVQSMDIETKARQTLASAYQGKRFNSPNDVIETRTGILYFTDPPYGLHGLNQSPLKEMEQNGVYRISANQTVTRLIDDMTYPNGIVLSPDQKYLYISQSDPDFPNIRRFNLLSGKDEGVWFDMKKYIPDGPGLPDGMAVTTDGHIFATGPGGVFILTQEGEALGRIHPGRACANCTFGEDGRTLFLTAQDRLMRIRLKVRGLNWS